MSRASLHDLENHQDFVQRHIGPTPKQQSKMALSLGYDSLEDLIEATVPSAIRREQAMDLPGTQTEQAVIAKLRKLAQKNVLNKKTQYNFVFL